MFALCFSMVFWVLSIVLENRGFFILDLAMFLFIIVFMLVYLNTGNRFKK